MMLIEHIKELFKKHKEQSLFGRYITNDNIEPLIKNLNDLFEVNTIGYSVLNSPIFGLKFGSGQIRILMWSQMHGNESTTTKALFDFFNSISHSENGLDYILESCTFYVIPILNPDGAKLYTRVNANKVDLNRDAQNLTQPESNVLRKTFEKFKPHYCYNLHGQRTIFSAGKTNNSATMSFLSPAQDETCTVTPNRKVSMEVIATMNDTLQEIIPDQVGVYDDAFNINCVGDTFQSENVPTILFEAGHFHNDYDREFTRELIYTSYITSFDYIAKNNITGADYEDYFRIPENEKLFLDIIIRNANGYMDELVDIGIQYKEILKGEELHFVPVINQIGNLNHLHAHREIDAKGEKVLGSNNEKLTIGNENVLVVLKNERIALNAK